jgi:hypothetical protein
MRALDLLMEKFSGEKSFKYKEDALEKMIVVDVKIENLTGKKSGY